MGLLAAAVVVYLFNSDMDATAKLSWMFFISLAPIATAVFLLFTKLNVGHRKSRKRTAELTEMTHWPKRTTRR